MREYLVTWAIEVTAESHEAAARQALEIQRDPASLAVAFVVDNQVVDLLESGEVCMNCGQNPGHNDIAEPCYECGKPWTTNPSKED
jgi:hypothetical protein